jgi:hypothetical protein
MTREEFVNKYWRLGFTPREGKAVFEDLDSVIEDAIKSKSKDDFLCIADDKPCEVNCGNKKCVVYPKVHELAEACADSFQKKRTKRWYAQYYGFIFGLQKGQETKPLVRCAGCIGNGRNLLSTPGIGEIRWEKCKQKINCKTEY